MSSQGYRLSPEQRRVLAVAGSDPAFTAQLTYECVGALDVARLDRAVGDVVRCHEILRTRLLTAPGLALPLQHVDPPPATGERLLTVIEGIGDGRRLRAALDRERERASGPARWPCRFTLFAGVGRSLLAMTIRAWGGDGQTLVSIAGDLAGAYSRSGWMPERDVVPYVHYAEWRNGHAEWPEIEDLPAARLPCAIDARPAARRRHARVPIAVPVRHLERLQRLGAETDARLDDRLCAWFANAIAAMTGEDEFLIGRSSEAHAVAGLEGSVGLFTHVAPFACRLGGARRLADAVERVRVEALTWRERVAHTAPRMPRDASAYLPIAFEWHALPPERTSGSVTFRPGTLTSTTEPFDLRFLGTLAGGAPRFALEYDAARFNRTAVRLLADVMGASLAAEAGSPLRHLGAPAGARTSPRRRPPASAPDGSCVPCAIERQARRSPRAIAVACGDEQLTYGELVALADAIVERLMAIGIGRDAPVALLMDRSPTTIAAMLGVMKAGAAYAPLDPNQPDSWIAAALAQLSPGVVLVSRAFADRVPAAMRVFVVECLGDGSGRGLDCRAMPESAAYIVFTSGTTGTPKGVVIEHRQLAAYVRGVSAALELSPGWSFGTVSTLATDLAYTALYPTLCSGGTVHLVPESLWLDASGLADYVEQHHLDCLKIVPSHWNALAASGRLPVPGRRLVFGGETCTWRTPDGVRDTPAVAFNHYGPTETTVGVMTYRTSRRARRWSERVPIGRPLEGVEVAIVGASGDVVPAGVVGELLVAGPSVARGYLARPDATAAAFVPAPWAGAPGTRAYRTGDRARYLPDGTVECLGRADRQRKVRGHRIELATVERHIREHEMVRDAVVDVSAATGDLAAFVVSDVADQAELALVLRPFVASRLPASMVPSRFVPIAAVPLTRTGKVDYRALAELDARPAASAPPSTPPEQVLARFWRELLALDAVGIDDDFFECGGHSLLAMQLVARVRSAFGVPVLPQLLFDAPTIRSLARSLLAVERTPGDVDRAARTFLEAEAGTGAEHAQLA